jgi:hypothetical protein
MQRWVRVFLMSGIGLALGLCGCRPPATPTAPPPPYQVEGALVRAVLPYQQLDRAVCEWDILGQEAEAVFLWVVCFGHYRQAGVGETAVSLPVRVEVDAQKQAVRVILPRDGADYAPSVRAMFPPEVAQRALTYTSPAVAQRAEARLTRPDLPPLSAWLP